MRVKKVLTILFGSVILFLTSCGSIAPAFVRGTDIQWSIIEIRDDLSYDQAWASVIDVIAKKFEMEVISKDGAYGRTGWIYTWNPKNIYSAKYRTRVIFKFSADKRNVEVKTEAQIGGDKKWQSGFDTRLLATIKQDIMGVVGRTTI